MMAIGWLIFLSIYGLTLPIQLAQPKSSMLYKIGNIIFFIQFISSHIFWLISIVKAINGIYIKVDIKRNFIAIILASLIPILFILIVSLGIRA